MATIEDLANVIETVVDDKISKTKKQSASVIATVNSKDVDGTIWVTFEGGVEKTPITTVLADVEPGDKVAVRIENGRSYIDGNATSPSASGRTVNVVRKTADDAAKTAESAIEDAAVARTAAASAQESADEAEGAATAATTAAGNAQIAANAATFALSDVEKVVGTLEWIAEHGEYELTEDTAVVAGKVYYTRSGTSPNYTYTVVAEPKTSDIATYYELNLDESVQNFLASHLWLDSYGLNLTVDNSGGYRVHLGTVNGGYAMGMYILDQTGVPVGQFSSDGVIVGKLGSGNTIINGNGLAVYSPFIEGSITMIKLGVFGYGNVVDSIGNVTKGGYFTVGGRDDSADIGMSSIGVGSGVEASGFASSAFGTMTQAGGGNSHAEGYNTQATGFNAHAEGYRTMAKKHSDHAEGYMSMANGGYAHAQNLYTVANGEGQTTIGKYNVADTSSALIIGNGTATTARSNALTVDWSGNVECGTVNGVDLTQFPLIQRGTVSPAALAASSTSTTAITFADEFSASPTVIVGIRGQTQTEGIGRCSAWASNVSATGFTLNFRNDFTSSRTFGAYWVAVGGGTAGGSGRGGGDVSALEQRVAELEADMQALAEATAYVGANHISIDGTTVSDELNPITSGTIDGMEV